MPNHAPATDAPHANELVVEAIAGPETAARLGIPVGSVFEARHVVAPLDGSPSTAEVVDASTAERIRRRILGEKEE